MMGDAHTQITLINLYKRTSVSVWALVDTGTSYLIIPDEIALALGFDPEEFGIRRVTLADGRSIPIPEIGPLEVQIDDRKCFAAAFVTGDQCVLGCAPLQLMDLGIDPKEQRLIGRHPGEPLFRI